MHRFGIFVDAGYLYAASGTLLFGTRNRTRLAVDFALVTDSLRALANEHCQAGSEHLRTYWYDGARDLVPSPEQRTVAQLPGVKLRLGRLTQQGQKGVDSRIVRDLITLSTERAISYAFLLGGDEDLREGVAEAQERGVRVTLLGIEPPTEANLSPTLAMEADDVVVLNAAFVEPWLRLRQDEPSPSTPAPADPSDPLVVGRAFALAYSAHGGAATPATLVAIRPRAIPFEIDRELLRYTRSALGVEEVADEYRKGIRAGFWAALEELDS